MLGELVAQRECSFLLFPRVRKVPKFVNFAGAILEIELLYHLKTCALVLVWNACCFLINKILENHWCLMFSGAAY